MNQSLTDPTNLSDTPRNSCNTPKTSLSELIISCPSRCTTTLQTVIKAYSKAKSKNAPVLIPDTKFVGYALKVNPQE